MAFFSTYALYKQGTQTVVNWLATTAIRCGYETEVNKKKRNNNNKNKNRKLRLKEAKEIGAGSERTAGGSTATVEHISRTTPVTKQSTASNQTKQSSATNPTKNEKTTNSPFASPLGIKTITTTELLVMATYISEHFKDISDFEELPGMLEVLQDVISKRKQWSTGFQGQYLSTSSSNERHKHFVVILEEVQQILSGVMKALKFSRVSPSEEDVAASTPPSMEQRVLNNIFSILKLEDPADVGEAALPTKKTQPHVKITATYELEEEADEEIYPRIYCFFKDFIEMRRYIQQCWADYISGILDLAAVAVTTNVALEILQRTETELLESIPKKFNLTTFLQLSSFLYHAYALSRGVNPETRQQPGDVINMELKDVADSVSLPVYIILTSFLPLLENQNGTVPVMKPGFFGEIDMSGRELSWRERFNQHTIILLGLLSEFCIVNKIDSRPPVLDVLSQGIIEMVKTKNIPIWVVLGCQLHLDIHDAIASHPFGTIDKAHKDLQNAGLHAAQTLKSYAEFSKNMTLETWPSENDAILQSVRYEVEEWINKDTYFIARKSLFQPSGLLADTLRPYSLFSRHPLLCGVMLFRLNLDMEYAGTTLVNAWGALPTVLHLYNALKHESPNADFPAWEDLEAVIKIHGKERIFIGEFPDNPVQYFKHFCLVMGYSASMFASNRREGRNTRQSQTPASKRGPREMTTTSAITDVFKPQYCDALAQSDVTFHRIQELLFASVKKSQRAASFLAVPFLSSLCNKIQGSILALNIDYFALHMRCFDLLRDIHTSLDSAFVKFLGSPMYLEKETQLPFLVGYLFIIAAETARTGEILKISGRGNEVRSKTLLEAGEIVKRVIQKEGKQEIERIKNCCRGYDWLSS